MNKPDILQHSIRLGVNIDHVATIRNARGEAHPDPVRAAMMAQSAGADSITAHLREDRRHITDADMRRLRQTLDIPLNMEMAATEEMLSIALDTKPHAACIVPENRAERTTEGGLDAAGGHNRLAPLIQELKAARIRVSLFLEAEACQLEAAAKLAAPVVELHTGRYCEAWRAGQYKEIQKEYRRLAKAAAIGQSLGLEIHAGHGLDFETAEQIAAIVPIREFNIGHFLVGEAILTGLKLAIKTMRQRMNKGRQNALSEDLT